MTVWILVAEAVYDHGIYGVFAEEEAAVAHAELLLDGSDYHHTIRVEPWQIDEIREADRRLTGGLHPDLLDAVQRRGRGRPDVRVVER